jgi:CRP-like cAMP-binding protein
MEELQKVFEYLKNLVQIEYKDLEPILGHFKKESFQSKSLIFSEGEQYQKVTFILSGLVKKYYLTNDGKEFIKEFTWENQITTPYASLLMNGPTTYTMEALEDTVLLSIDYSFIKSLMNQNPKWMELGKAFAEMHFLSREAREMELLKYNAFDRYMIFKTRFPNLLNRLKKQDIASYLGITPVSLSRLESQN